MLSTWFIRKRIRFWDTLQGNKTNFVYRRLKLVLSKEGKEEANLLSEKNPLDMSDQRKSGSVHFLRDLDNLT